MWSEPGNICDTMSYNDKVQETRRRLAAISFLYNISLNGTYKDTAAVRGSSFDGSGRDGFIPAEANVHVNVNPSLLDGDASAALGFDEGSVPGAQYSPDEQGFDKKHKDLVPGRKRTNTTGGIGEIGYLPGLGRQLLAELDTGFHGNHNPKRAHFSSTESIDHGGIARGSHVNISDTSLQPPNDTKIVNLRTSPWLTFKDERLVILVSQRTPVVIFSAIGYSRNNRQSNRSMDRTDGIRRTRNVSGSRPISSLSDPDPLETLIHNSEEEVSYGYLILPRKGYTKGVSRIKCGEANPEEVAANSSSNTKHFPVSRCVSYDAGVKLQSGSGSENASPPEMENQDVRHISPFTGAAGGSSSKVGISAYSPHMLDDPEFRAGKHRTLLTFPSYITSVIDYCKAADMKKELNDKFKDRFPHILLTLSKLRSLKREMRKVAKAECNIDLLTVAQAYVYFEKLILGSFVTKYNRKFCAGACLLLSAKLNDVKGFNLHNLIEMIERTFRVSKKDLLSFEFAVLVALEFTLHLPTWEVFPHYQRLLYES